MEANRYLQPPVAVYPEEEITDTSKIQRRSGCSDREKTQHKAGLIVNEELCRGLVGYLKTLFQLKRLNVG